MRAREGDWGWRAAFVAGLCVGGGLLVLVYPSAFGDSPASPSVVALGGLLVGYGTRMGNGCTSGHGVCGLSRLSVRSLVAVLTFLAAGAGVASLYHGLP